MECIFLNSAGQTLFVRGDLESGHWVQQEMNVTADFPFVADKKIERGMRIAFRSPVDDTLQVFEVRIVTIQEPEHFQQITAENIALSELSDEHIDSQQLTDQTAAQALATALTGTLWSVGNNTSTGTQSADFSRGSVWDAVNTIKQNWNVFITPRVVISSAGAITGRYLDIAPAQGVFRGLRLAVRKNLLDPAVTYDDEDVYTAMYGYGGNVDKPQAGGDDTTEELTFADEVWTATADHPAKPAGQTYLEWPEKTALYGRNGRPRFGYYQNGNIKDAGVLLEKTWESLKLASTPKLSVAGTVVDLYRLGYHDEPIQLNDLAIVEIEETGELFQKQIICCDIDLVDPTGSRVEIGDFIPNIVYINRETDKKASGGGGGGGRGPKSMTNLEDEETKAYTTFYNTGRQVGMIIGTKDGIDYINAPQITLAINDWDGSSKILLKADTIDIDGVVESLEAYTLTVQNIDAQYGQSVFSDIFVTQLTVDETVDCYTLDASVVDTTDLTVNSQAATWQTYTARYCAMASTGKHYFLYSSSSGSTTPTGAVYGYVVGTLTNTTIHYLGSAST